MAVVFVYGTLRQGSGNNRLLESSRFLGQSLTKERYAMYSLGGCPAVDLTKNSTQIVIEAYECDEATMTRLDRLEGYRGPSSDNFYDRSLVESVDFGSGLMYHIDNRYNDDREITSGDWYEHRAQRYI